MKINFKQELGTFNGTRLMYDEKTPWTLQTACVESLGAIYRDEQSVAAEEKFKRYMLAEKIINATKTTDFTIDEVSMLRTMVGKHPSPIIVGRVWEILEKAAAN